jgi:hypothetical protein
MPTGSEVLPVAGSVGVGIEDGAVVRITVVGVGNEATVVGVGVLDG